MASSYLTDILNTQNQRKVTGASSLTPQQVEAAFQGDIAARYNAADNTRRTNLTERQVALGERAQAAQEGQFAATMGLNQQKMALEQERADYQQGTDKMQSIVNAVGAVGKLGVLYNMYNNTPKISPTVDTLQPATGEGLVGPDYTVGGGDTSKYAAYMMGGEGLSGGEPLSGSDVFYKDITDIYNNSGALFNDIGYEPGVVSNVSDSIFSNALDSMESGFGTITDSISSAASYVGSAIASIPSSSVLCSELARQGLLKKEILIAEREYVKKNVKLIEYIGYRIMADPVVKLMQTSLLATNLLAPFIRAFADELAHRQDKKFKGSKLGSLILRYGLPLCYWVGKKRKHKICEIKKIIGDFNAD